MSDFLRENGDSIISGRELARIVHGQKAPSHAAVSRSSAQRDRRQNAAPDDLGEDERAGFGLSPFSGHMLWGRYKSIDFPTVLARCDQYVQEWHTHATARRAAESAVMEKRRQAKRQKLEHQATTTAVDDAATRRARPTIAAPAPAVASFSSVMKRLPTSSALSVSTTMPTFKLVAPLSIANEEIVIPSSDEEE